MFHHILLASHGTEGAQAAETLAIQVCASAGRIDHLIVVPEFWRNMTGDDWLNSGTARNQFRDYLQTALGQEVDQHRQRVAQKTAAQGLSSHSVVLFGKPERALLHQTEKNDYDLIVVGSPRTGGKKSAFSLRSSMLDKKILRALPAALLIAPYPAK